MSVRRIELPSQVDGSVLVAEFLADNRRILKQPPYEWLADWLDKTYPGLFKTSKERGFVRLMRALARVDQPVCVEEINYTPGVNQLCT